MRALIMAALVIGYPLASASAETAEGLAVLSASKDFIGHYVIVGGVEAGQWVACWGLNDDGTPVAKGVAIVQGRFVEVPIIAQDRLHEISDYYCEYQR